MDLHHFSNLSPPLSPSQKEVDIYKSYIKEDTLLLGYTKELYPFVKEAIDWNPPDGMKVTKGDWMKISDFYDVIIGDGVINLAGPELIDHLKNKCNALVIRFFLKKLDGMKYATHFREECRFLLPDEIIHTQEGCVILVWNF